MSEPKKTAASKFWSHAMTLTIVGFILSAGVGTLIQQLVAKQQRDHAALVLGITSAQQREIAAQDALVDLVTDLHTRTARGGMLRSAIARNASGSGPERKLSYDNALFVWNSNLNANLIRLRRFMVDDAGDAFTGQSMYEEYVVASVRISLLRMDNCLTLAFDHWGTTSAAVTEFMCRDGDELPETNWNTVVNNTRARAQTCMEAIMTDALRYFRAVRHAQEALLRNSDADADFPRPNRAYLDGVCHRYPTSGS